MHYTVLLDSHNPAGTQIHEAKLQALVCEGTVIATTQVWDPQKGRWIDAQNHPDLHALFSQSLWDAWEEDANLLLVEPEKESSNVSKQEEISLEHTPFDAEQKDVSSINENTLHIAVQDEVENERRAFDTEKDVQKLEKTIPFEGVNELDTLMPLSDEDVGEEADAELPMLSELSLIPLDEVSSRKDFHQIDNDEKNHSVIHNVIEQRANPSLPLNIPPRRQRPEVFSEPKSFSFVRIAIPIVIGALVIFAMMNYVQSLNQREFIRPKEAPALSIEPNKKVWSIEAEVREKVGEDIIPLNPEASFEDILHIELQRVGLTSIQIRAAVTKWTGRKEEEPKEIMVRLRAESSGELDRDIATVSLIFGKYIEYYFLDVELLEVCFAPNEESFLCSPLNPDIIRRFYLKRITYNEFFDKIFSLD